MAAELRHPRTFAAVAAWSARVTKAGALRTTYAPCVEPLAEDAADLPGGPVAILMPGHTTGHTGYHLPGSGALVTGDGLVTGHPLLPDTGPQLLPPLFHHGNAVDGLAALDGLDVDLLLPGHGEPLRIPIRDAVRAAERRAPRRV